LIGLALRLSTIKNIVGGIVKDGDGLWGLSGMLRSKLRELGKGLPIDAMGKLGLVLRLVHGRVGCGIHNVAGLEAFDGLGQRRTKQIGPIKWSLVAGKAKNVNGELFGTAEPKQTVAYLPPRPKHKKSRC
jgi:hypothetical protein